MPIALGNQVPNDTSENKLQNTCCHCGEDIGGVQIFIDKKAFCCQGCKMVYEILNANDLANYYQIEQQAGISLKGLKRERYTWLEDEEIVSKLIDFQDDKITKVTFLLPQIHCASCIWLLENLYKLNDGILHSKVNFLKKEAYLTFDNQKVNLRKTVELLALIGYPPSINLNNLEESQKAKATDRTFQYQLGIAGFAFGNIMLLSFPEYLGLADVVFQKWFGYLNLLIALPVLLYSGRDYLQSAWYGLRQSDLNIDVPISLGILTLFGRSAFEVLTHTGAGYFDSLAGLIFFLLIGKWFQQQTYHRLSFERDYKSYFPIAAAVKRNGIEQSVTLNNLNIGDTVIIRHKELIPADGILLRGNARIDYSFVTGESDPVRKTIGDKIFAGGRQVANVIEVTLTKKVSQSYLTQLWNEDAFQKEDSPNASRLANKVGKRFTYFILFIAFATLFYWLPHDTGLAVNAFTAVLIIACPCAVALSIPFTFGNAIRLLAKQNFYLKNTQVIENLSKVDTIIFDKTGTITDASKTDIHYQGEALSDAEKVAIRSLVQQSAHPVSRQIDAYFGKYDIVEVVDFEEITGQGIRGFAKGFFIQIERHKTGTSLQINGNQKGVFTLQNSYRTGLSELISSWRDHYQLYLLSGDNDRERAHLESDFEASNLHFQQSPKDKLEFIQQLQAQGKNVLMLGDGLNDAGALRQSDVGIVIAENTNNFTPACDAVVDAKQFAQLNKFIAFAKGNVKLVYFAYLLAFIYNIIGLSFAVQGLLSPVIAAILMPLSSVTIVAFGVLGSGWLGVRGNKK